MIFLNLEVHFGFPYIRLGHCVQLFKNVTLDAIKQNALYNQCDQLQKVGLP